MLHSWRGASLSPYQCNSKLTGQLLQYLEENGIRPILNYAAEDDVSDDADEAASSCPHAAAERCLDRNMAIFMRSIRDSDNARNRAFVAIKVTHE